MAKTFLRLLFSAFLLNFVIKTVTYFSYNKTPGTVIDLMGLSSLRHTAKGTFEESAIAPVIEYTIDNKEYTATKKEWGFWTYFEMNDTVTVMYSDEPEDPKINRFFPYWLRLVDMCWIFGSAAVGTIVYETIRFYRNENKDKA